MIKKIQKYMRLERRNHQNLDLCHILILETLLDEPDKWFNHSHFKRHLKSYQYHKAVIALTGNIKDSINNVRIWEKNLFWVDKRTSPLNKTMNEIKISKKGLKELLFTFY